MMRLTGTSTLQGREDVRVPTLIAAAGASARLRFLEFFTAKIRNPHTRRAYGRAAGEFLAWCQAAGVPSLAAVQPLHVATWIEGLTRSHTAPTAKQRLAAVRHLFDWLVVGQVVAVNPAASVRGPRHVVRVEDVYVQNRRLWVRLREKGGKAHALPCHHTLEDYLAAYLDGAGLRDDPKGPLFRTIGRGTGRLSERPLPQASAHAMVRRRAAAAGIETRLGCHSFRVTGITAYLANGGTLETAAAMANHASTRTTQLYDRRGDRVSLDEVERIRI
ncbi:MAG TPA: tyrosine-type recombinase/integrase [Azospirillum sp.]|nr:tyrosine-type recombinase/integrase [Azospirillum sp.]